MTGKKYTWLYVIMHIMVWPQCLTTSHSQIFMNYNNFISLQREFDKLDVYDLWQTLS